MKTFTYLVKGKDGFPMDMLRYDAAWPADPDAVDAIWENIFYHDRERKVEVNLVLERAAAKPIRLRSHYEPTKERWNSFGWIVLRVVIEKG